MARATVQAATARPAVAGTAHPLASSMTTVGRCVEWMSFVFEDVAGPGWLRCEQVLREPGFFTGWRATVARYLAEQHGTVPDRTPAAYVLQWYLRIPAYTGAMLFHSARRVPALAPRRLAFRLEPAWVETIALRPGPFWCLPADPDARHPDAVVVPDDGALATVLRQQVVAHAARFLRVYGPTVRFGRHTLWAAVTDMIDSGLLVAGRSRGDEAAGMADARLV
ncbi:MAG: iron-sulfur protein, partial [Actinobacteria bacterium]|nr:iron-sulfur protein [Actinomycetota bacterium]